MQKLAEVSESLAKVGGCVSGSGLAITRTGKCKKLAVRALTNKSADSRIADKEKLSGCSPLCVLDMRGMTGRERVGPRRVGIIITTYIQFFHPKRINITSFSYFM